MEETRVTFAPGRMPEDLSEVEHFNLVQGQATGLPLERKGNSHDRREMKV
ncbi:MAG: hypothetical protein PHU23_16865 [Dehalococcoidales bacterium]|nr:hypothetical protein [Dehalococcoidales bacterium]